MPCPHCGSQIDDAARAQGHCPSCGLGLGAAAAPNGGLISAYLADLKTLLLAPRRFFREKGWSGGMTYPLAFALITHWISTAIGYLWRSGTARFFGSTDLLSRLSRLGGGRSGDIDVFTRSRPWTTARQLATQWIFGVGSVLADPFGTVLVVFLSAAFIFIGARLLVPATREDGPAPAVTFESAVRIRCWATAVSILGILPLAGSFLAWAYGLYISVIAAKDAYRVGTSRAMAIVFFPWLLLMALLAAVIGLMMAVFFGTFWRMSS